MRYAVILAGGSGSRLWPASRQERPKQLLKIGHGEEPLIAAAVALGRKIAGERVMIVTAEASHHPTYDHCSGDGASAIPASSISKSQEILSPRIRRRAEGVRPFGKIHEGLANASHFL